MDTLHVTRLEPVLRVWECRLNGDGKTFDAICTVHAVGETTAEVTGLLSRVEHGYTRMSKLLEPWFDEQGFDAVRYMHDGKLMERRRDK